MADVFIEIPDGWDKLSDRQAAVVISVMSLCEGLSREEALLICSLRLSGIKMLKASADGALLMIPKVYVHGKAPGNIVSCFPYERLRGLVASMRWALDMPHIPWRPSRLMKARPTERCLTDLTFGQFLQADALYHGYITKKDPEMMVALAKILVPGAKRPPASWEIQAMVMWFASAKVHLAKKFSSLFAAPAGSPGGSMAPVQGSIGKSVDAQLRALTKGDPLKEDAVLQLPLYRALTELDAQAEEYSRIKQMQKK